MKIFPNLIDITNYRHERNGKLWFKQLKNNEYVLDTDTPYILEYMRLGFTDSENEYYMVDPSGGPYIDTNSKFGKYSINKIYKDNTTKQIIFKLK